MTVGLKEVVAAARELGLDASLKEVPSMALGSNEVTLLDLTGAFASVRAGRAKLEPWGITAFASDAGGLRSLGAPAAPERELPQNEQLTRLLRDVVERGTGRAAALNGASVAGKTGTSQDHRDAWFVGFTDDLVVGVWIGNDDRSPMKGMTGGSLPAQIWKSFVTTATPLLARSNKPEVAEGAEAPHGQASNQPQCSQHACAARYSSFRASDCTYQPYSGPRRLCDLQDGNVEAGRKDARGRAQKADLTSNKSDLSTSLHDTERDMRPPEEGRSGTSQGSRSEAAMGLGNRDLAGRQILVLLHTSRCLHRLDPAFFANSIKKVVIEDQSPCSCPSSPLSWRHSMPAHLPLRRSAPNPLPLLFPVTQFFMLHHCLRLHFARLRVAGLLSSASAGSAT